jgi:hypothetical protein
MDVQRKKERTFEILLRQVTSASPSRPVLAVFEDAHWADPSSLEFPGFASSQRFQFAPFAADYIPTEFPSSLGWPATCHLDDAEANR